MTWAHGLAGGIPNGQIEINFSGQIPLQPDKESVNSYFVLNWSLNVTNSIMRGKTVL